MGRRKGQVFSITKNAYVVKSILIKKKIPYQSLYSLYERLCNSSCCVTPDDSNKEIHISSTGNKDEHTVPVVTTGDKNQQKNVSIPD
jgi:hypothetical protein